MSDSKGGCEASPISQWSESLPCMCKALGSTLQLRRQAQLVQHHCSQECHPQSEPAPSAAHLGVSHIHASGVQPVLYLLCIVDLQEVITTKLHIC